MPWKITMILTINLLNKVSMITIEKFWKIVWIPSLEQVLAQIEV